MESFASSCSKSAKNHAQAPTTFGKSGEYAAQYGHLNYFKYAIEHGCPWNKEECLKVAKGECKQYILDN